MTLSAIKKMAPQCFAFDQNVCMEIMSHHLAQVSQIPSDILECLKRGFTVSITGSAWSNVALDEAHKMLINILKQQLCDQQQNTYKKPQGFLITELSLIKIS